MNETDNHLSKLIDGKIRNLDSLIEQTSSVTIREILLRAKLTTKLMDLVGKEFYKQYDVIDDILESMRRQSDKYDFEISSDILERAKLINNTKNQKLKKFISDYSNYLEKTEDLIRSTNDEYNSDIKKSFILTFYVTESTCHSILESNNVKELETSIKIFIEFLVGIIPFYGNFYSGFNAIKNIKNKEKRKIQTSDNLLKFWESYNDHCYTWSLLTQNIIDNLQLFNKYKNSTNHNTKVASLESSSEIIHKKVKEITEAFDAANS